MSNPTLYQLLIGGGRASGNLGESGGKIPRILIILIRSIRALSSSLSSSLSCKTRSVANLYFDVTLFMRRVWALYVHFDLFLLSVELVLGNYEILLMDLSQQNVRVDQRIVLNSLPRICNRKCLIRKVDELGVVICILLLKRTLHKGLQVLTKTLQQLKRRTNFLRIYKLKFLLVY